MDMRSILKGFSPEFIALYESIDPKILDIEGIGTDQLQIISMADHYFSDLLVDMSIDANANAHESKSYGNYISEIAKSWFKLIGYYRLYQIVQRVHSRERADALLAAVWKGDLYFHDSTSIEIPYCWAYSTYPILLSGCQWGQLQSYPPKNRRSFLDQVKEVTIEFAQEVAGAVAIGDFFVNYSYFVRKENLDLNDPAMRKSIENDFQSLVHTINKKLRPSHQSPFTNISIFDKPNLELLFGEQRFPDGSRPDIDCIWEIQKIFCEWFKQGDPATGFPYRWPIVTLNLRIDENRAILDTQACDYFSAINLERACFNIYISSGNKIASCCRLVNDLELAGCDSFGNGGISLGSHRVVTINLARLGRLAGSFEALRVMLKSSMDDARDMLIAHRTLLRERHKQGFLNFFNRGFMDDKRLFSTFGINGLYECFEELGCNIKSPEGQKLASQLLEEIRAYATQTSIEQKVPFNVEQVPAESLAIKFAIKDAYLYGMDYDIYANQFIPLWEDCDIVDRITIDGTLSKCLTGGGISHLNIGEKLTNVQQMKKLIQAAIKAGCEHFAVNYNFGVCHNDHVSVCTPHALCPICAAGMKDFYTRIVGYYVPVSSWNKGRRKEHANRIFKKDDLDNTILPAPQATMKQPHL